MDISCLETRILDMNNTLFIDGREEPSAMVESSFTNITKDLPILHSKSFSGFPEPSEMMDKRSSNRKRVCVC